MSKILVIEDDEILRETMAQFWRKGFDVSIAIDGEDGVNKALTEKPTLYSVILITNLMDLKCIRG